MTLVYEDLLGNRFKLKASVSQILHTHRQNNKEDKEAGGVLLGRYLTDSNDIVVDRITEPNWNDIRGRYKFIRQDIAHQVEIDEAWRESAGTCHYLGDWHTHPEDDPTPSQKDKSDWRRKLKEDIYFNRYLYFVIVGIKVTSIWKADNQTGNIEKLNYGQNSTKTREY